jgi:hypothetical protein
MELEQLLSQIQSLPEGARKQSLLRELYRQLELLD